MIHLNNKTGISFMKFKIVFILFWIKVCAPALALQNFYHANQVYGDEAAAGPQRILLSRHNMIDTGEPINAEGLLVASYNATGRSSLNSDRAIDEYENSRVQINIKRIIDYLLQHPNTFFGIQEWNASDIQQLQEAIADNSAAYTLVHAYTVPTPFRHGIIYSRVLYQPLAEPSSIDIHELNSLTAYHKADDILPCSQLCRYVHHTLSRHYTTYHVINVHLRKYSNPLSINPILEAIFARLPNCIIMGDFGADLSSTPLLNATLYISRDGCFHGTAPNYRYKTVDAIVHNIGYPSQVSLPQSFPSHIEALITSHISTQLQQNVTFLLSLNSILFDFDDFSELVRMTPNRSYEEFQLQTAQWNPYLISIINMIRRYGKNSGILNFDPRF
jgi:hypothetical protein